MVFLGLPYAIVNTGILSFIIDEAELEHYHINYHHFILVFDSLLSWMWPMLLTLMCNSLVVVFEGRET